jgi:hypothetical protein
MIFRRDGARIDLDQSSPRETARIPLKAHLREKFAEREVMERPDQPPALAFGRLDFPPNDIRSPNSGLQRSRIDSNLAGVLSAGGRRTPATRCLNIRPPAALAAARAPRAATQPPRRRAA